VHIQAFSRWVHTRLERYPASLRTLLYAALTIVEHHEDLPNISKILIELVLKPSASERKKILRLHEQLFHFQEPEQFTKLFRVHQEHCNSYGPLMRDLRLQVNASAYAELAVKLAHFILEMLVSSYPTAFSQIDASFCSASGSHP